MAADLIGSCLEDDVALKTRAPLLFGICFTKENFKSLENDIETIKNNRSKVSEFNIHTESTTSLKDKVTESIIRTWAMSHVEGGAMAAVFDDNRPDINPIAVTNDVPPPAVYITAPNKMTWRTSRIVPISEQAVRPSSQTEEDHKQKELKPSPIALYMLYQMLQTNQTTCIGDGAFGRDLLLYALKENLYDITEVLVDKGVTLEFSQAKDLYQQLYDERKEKNQTRSCIAEIIKVRDEAFPKKREDAWEIGCDIIPYKIAKGEKKEPEGDNWMTPSDLLLWAVLTNQMEMAEIFWKRSPEPILTALVASAILHKMSRRAHSKKETDFKKTMLMHSRVFRQRAIDVTQSLFENNEMEAIFVLEVENSTSVWGIKESCLEFSQAHNISQFVSHHVPQRSFDRIWKGAGFFHDNDLYETKKTVSSLSVKNFIIPLTARITSPFWKFVIHYSIFCLFLVCLSAFIMTNITTEKWPIDRKSIYEYCANLWLFADIIEEYVPPAFYTIRLKELMRFVVIMAVFILSAGVFYHANIYPNHYDMFSPHGMRYWSVWQIIYYPYWSIYGEFKDEIDGEDSTDTCSRNETVYMNDPDIVRCPEKDWMVSLMSGVFVLTLNLLLVNLIIAMFR
ncbi:Transient receptor potential cation channel subfamily M member 3 [Mizuhopecten yessoensis]|uniref:Transient receptor potential cation channel subfamily M member 3 n=1 Tax=Mizuhopecten yessoensis TaxID=6573 RepID=A0A210PF83_MIZYE|nr:Transient receptor potential cation channel subfamily M member 3 [Mizuhopecten yessoensis]